MPLQGRIADVDWDNDNAEPGMMTGLTMMTG